MSTNIKIIIQIKGQNIELTLEEGENLFNELKKIYNNNQKPIIRESINHAPIYRDSTTIPTKIPSVLPTPQWPESQPLITYKIEK